MLDEPSKSYDAPLMGCTENKAQRPNIRGSVQPGWPIVLWQIILSSGQIWWWWCWIHLKVHFNMFPTSTHGSRATSRVKIYAHLNLVLPAGLNAWSETLVRTTGCYLCSNLQAAPTHLIGSSPLFVNINKPSSWLRIIQFWELYVWTGINEFTWELGMFLDL